MYDLTCPFHGLRLIRWLWVDGSQWFFLRVSIWQRCASCGIKTNMLYTRQLRMRWGQIQCQRSQNRLNTLSISISKFCFETFSTIGGKLVGLSSRAVLVVYSGVICPQCSYSGIQCMPSIFNTLWYTEFSSRMKDMSIFIRRWSYMWRITGNKCDMGAILSLRGGIGHCR